MGKEGRVEECGGTGWKRRGELKSVRDWMGKEGRVEECGGTGMGERGES